MVGNGSLAEKAAMASKEDKQVSDNTNHQKTLKNLLKRMLIVKKKTLKHMMNIMTMKKQIMHM